MTIIVKESNVKEVTLELKKQIKKKEEQQSLKKHFGKLKRNIDGLKYQLEIRSDED